jgi:hypothetical protein
MEMLNQIDPKLQREVRRRQAEFWDSCIRALAEALEQAFPRLGSEEPRISVEEVTADLAYGRD